MNKIKYLLVLVDKKHYLEFIARVVSHIPDRGQVMGAEGVISATRKKRSSYKNKRILVEGK